MKRIWIACLAVLLAVCTLACGAEEPAPAAGADAQPEEASVNYQIVLEPEAVMTVGESRQLNAVVTPESAVTWQTEDARVVRVSQDGLLTAVGEGNCAVTAVCADDTAVTARCIVTVSLPQEPAEEENPPLPAGSELSGNGILVAVDAGHQGRGDYDKEPLGPGSDEMKTRVSSGTQGVSTGLAEYELNLQVALRLQTELEARGYEVLMIRTTNDVSVSNAERAELANEAGADALVRIHANGSENPDVSGAMTICMTQDNPYNAALYDQSRLLSQNIIDSLCAVTGAQNRGIWETDTMTGINWSEVPVTIVEMGYMTNPSEDELLAAGDYQDKIVSGIADGLDLYFDR